MGEPWTDSWRDHRRVHLLTRGNVDGITSTALVLARWPDARVHYVTNATVATQHLRRDLGSDRFLVIDVGLTPLLAKTLGRKTAEGREAVLLDHHQQTLEYIDHLPADVDRMVLPGISAAAVTQNWLGDVDLPIPVAIADHVEYCRSPVLDQVVERYGQQRVEEESRMLDFAWRLQITDDRFRLATARRLGAGLWPSEIPEVAARYTQMLNEGRWERALERVRSRIQVRGNIALLRFGRRKPSLFGFGSRALTAIAEEIGCGLALMVHKRSDVTSISARVLSRPRQDLPVQRLRRELDLGKFLDEFTQQYGIAGGGHPESAGGKIPSRHLETFLKEIEVFA